MNRWVRNEVVYGRKGAHTCRELKGDGKAKEGVVGQTGYP